MLDVALALLLEAYDVIDPFEKEEFEELSRKILTAAYCAGRLRKKHLPPPYWEIPR